MKRLFLLVLFVLLVLVNIAGAVALNSGIAVTDSSGCFRNPIAEKCFTFTNTGIATYVIEFNGTTSVNGIKIDADTEEYCTYHTFNKVEVTVTGGSGIIMVLRCR